MKKIVIFIVIAVFICMLTAFIFSDGKTIRVEVKEGTIYGELLHCSNDVVVVIIAGSGPTDMNGNTPLIQGKNDSFLQLAYALKDEGISTFRYDKRSAGKSAETFDNTKMTTFDDMADDLNACITELRNIGYKKIILAGHSQGSLLGMLASANVDGYISIAGSGYSVNETMLRQYSAEANTFSNEIETIKMLERGIFNKDYAEKNTIFSINNQKFLMSWMKYDPRLEITKVKCPLMILQGDADLQVLLDDYNELQSATPNTESYVINDMNHLLKRVKNEDENIKSYQDPSFAVHHELITIIANFVKEVKNG